MLTASTRHSRQRKNLHKRNKPPQLRKPHPKRSISSSSRSQTLQSHQLLPQIHSIQQRSFQIAVDQVEIPASLDPTKQYIRPEFQYLDSASFVKKWENNSDNLQDFLTRAHTHEGLIQLDSNLKKEIQTSILSQKDKRPSIYVDTASALNIVLDLLHRDNDFIAMDLEFASDRSFMPALELMQLSTRNGMLVTIDFMRLGQRCKPLVDLLCTKRIILHGGAVDIQVLTQLQFQFDVPCIPQEIVDTQFLAGYLDFSPLAIGLGKLIKYQFGIFVPKGLGQSDWSHRPLTNMQIEYAFNDVRYLHQMKDDLEQRIHVSKPLQIFHSLDTPQQTSSQQIKRHSIVQKEMQQYVESKQKLTIPDDAWVEVVQSTHEQLEPDDLSVLKVLAKWRYIQAYRSNKSPRLVMKDSILIYLAQNRPSADEIKIQFASTPFVRANANILKQLIDAVDSDEIKQISEEGSDSFQTSPRKKNRPTLDTTSQSALYAVLHAVLYTIAADNKMTPEWIAPVGDLKELIQLVHKHYKQLELDAVKAYVIHHPEIFPIASYQLPADSIDDDSTGTTVNHIEQEIYDGILANEVLMVSIKNNINYRLDINHLPPQLAESRLFTGFRREFIGVHLLSIVNGDESVCFQAQPQNQSVCIGRSHFKSPLM